jgi:prepilin-type N-terminal cleavage/methylation domain-containing protein
MLTSSVGATSNLGSVCSLRGPIANRPQDAILPHMCVLGQCQRGITLIEMLIVMAIIALLAGLSYPSVTAGLDSLRLRSTSDAIIGFFNTALARADTRQQAVEILISPAEGTIEARSGDRGFYKRLEVSNPMKILSVQPALAADAEEQGQTRRFLVYPGGSVPKIAIEIGNSNGRKRLVSIDPVTGVPQSNAQ